MTDELTPEREAAISRLLAEARHDGPIPADVAARLDAVLGDLSADDLEVFENATVTELAVVRHRRRNAGRLLLAAAAVVVGGVAVGQNLGDRAGSDDADSSTAADGADNLEVPREAAANDAGGSASAFGDEKDDGAAAPEMAPVDGSAEYSLTTQLLDEFNAPLSLTADNFVGEVQRNLGEAPGSRRAAAVANLDALVTYAAMTLFTCPDADYGDGAKLPAYFDDQEAVLVLRRPEDGVQRVDLLRCGTADEIATTDLPAR